MALLPAVDLDINTDTDYPVLQSAQVVGAFIANAEVAYSGKNKPMIHVTLKTTTVARDKKGKEVPPGYFIHDYINLQPETEQQRDMCSKQFCGLQDAALGTQIGTRIPLDQFDTDSLLDKQVLVKTKIKKASDDFAESTGVGRYLPPVK